MNFFIFAAIGLLSLAGANVCGQGKASGGAASILDMSKAQVISATVSRNTCARPEALIDGNPTTQFEIIGPNTEATVTIDLGRPCEIRAVRVTNGKTNPMLFLREVAIGPDDKHFRALLSREINLPVWRGGDVEEITVRPSVGRLVRITVFCGGNKGEISEVTFVGRENKLERHLLCWSGDVQKDFLDKIDYLDKDLGVTDLWLDYVATGFPQTNHNSGLQIWVDTGALKEFKNRGIRYWLGEHEAFTSMVREPKTLHDDVVWETTFRQMRQIYTKAHELGFAGLVYDAEDYTNVTEETKKKYKDRADWVSPWTFFEEFGPSGKYYERGRQVGKIIHETIRGPLIQLYEARMYAGQPGCRDGNYWWLKGIYDEGVEIWIATEKTYGAGKGEVSNPEGLAWLRSWFVDMHDFIPSAFQAFPFATRIIPGFHPWNCRLKAINYLPKYFDEQLTIAQTMTPAFWLYCEGNPSAGDPRDTLDRTFLKKYGVTPEDYLKVLSKHSSLRGR